MSANEIVLPAGVYRHWKGPLYLVIGLAHDANSDELFWHKDGLIEEVVGLKDREVVVYVGLQLTSAHMGARLAVRTLDDFLAMVCQRKEHVHYGKQTEDGDVCDAVQRFEFLGERLELNMVVQVPQ